MRLMTDITKVLFRRKKIMFSNMAFSLFTDHLASQRKESAEACIWPALKIRKNAGLYLKKLVNTTMKRNMSMLKLFFIMPMRKSLCLGLSELRRMKDISLFPEEMHRHS